MLTIVRIAFLVVAVVVGLALGETYIARLPNHAGYFLVPVADEVKMPLPARPRHTVLIVIDGLRRDSAETMASAKAIAAKGQCRISDQGDYTVSRPEYARMSAGLESDRSGSRNNDLGTPIAVESVWEVARESKLVVTGNSHLPWWRELFPRGFDRYRMPDSHADDLFAHVELSDLVLIHPLYVDDAGHHFGGASREYAAAVQRADREIGEVLGALDLDRDVVLLTADHGHTDAGGHGGAQPIIEDVLLCIAGPGVVHAEGRARFDGRVTGPLLSVLLGIRFPKHMRASEDGLDAIFDIVRLDEGYVSDRRAAVSRFRAANLDALKGWGVASWSELYAREGKKQWLRWSVALVFAIALLVKRRPPPVWLALVTVATWGAHRIIIGPFDYTYVNLREQFLARAFSVVVFSMALAVILHALLVRRGLARMCVDMTTVVALLLVVNLGHIVAYSWPLGFPCPGAAMRYFPFFGAIALFGYALTTTGLAIFARRSRSESPRGSARSPA